MIWHSKHQVFDQIEENLVFWKNQTIRFTKPNSAKLDGPSSETGGSGISRNSNKSSKTMTFNHNDWRTPLVHYLENPDHIADRKVQRQALKYVVLDGVLYHRTIDSLLLKWLRLD
jgi:hypothetical protein